MKQNLQRNIAMTFRVNEKERKSINNALKRSGMQNRREYLLRMAVNGHIINIELDSVDEMVRLLANATSNINQIARKVNETGNIHVQDMEAIKARQDEITAQMKVILRRICKILEL